MIIQVKYEDLTDADREQLLNGCGPSNARFYDVPNLVFRESCNRHDFEYSVGGPRDCGDDSTYRERADLNFLESMYEAANSTSWYVRWWYNSMARTYYTAVRKFGSSSFSFRSNDTVVTIDLLRVHDLRSRKNGTRRGCSAFVRAMKDSGKWK